MKYNYQSEKNRFEREWVLLENAYRNAGMNEKTIENIRNYDRMRFNRDRSYRTRTVFIDDFSYLNDDGDKEENVLVKRNIDKFRTYDDYFMDDINRWFELIDDERLILGIMTLSHEYLEIFRDYYVFGKTQTAVAEKHGLTRREVQGRLNRIKKHLKNYR